MQRLTYWDRDFRLWHYTVSYSQLLLRNIDSKSEPARIDVLFSNVTRMQVGADYAELAIDEIVDRNDPVLVLFGINFPQRGKVYLINGGPDHVVATHCHWHADEGGAHSPSTFGPLRGTE